jgi:hypothetical protein
MVGFYALVSRKGFSYSDKPHYIRYCKTRKLFVTAPFHLVLSLAHFRQTFFSLSNAILTYSDDFSEFPYCLYLTVGIVD